MIAGVYKIEHAPTGRKYIGSAKDVSKRISHHKWALKSNKHANILLQNSYNKHGIEQFVFTPLLYCSNDNLVMYEQLIMDEYKANEKLFGFNIRKIVDSNIGLGPSENNKAALKLLWNDENFRKSKMKVQTGDKYNKLTLLECIGKRGKHLIWLCRCDCGNEVERLGASVRSGGSRSCGCDIKKKKAGRNNAGLTKNSEYMLWTKVKKNMAQEERLVFSAFLNDIGERPNNLCFTRKDFKKPYNRDNFCWVTQKESKQSNPRYLINRKEK